MSLSEETLASFKSAWELVSPAVFGFSERVSVRAHAASDVKESLLHIILLLSLISAFESFLLEYIEPL